ncbi:hypothetical protein Y032_0702g1664 [Ancylostoma ceylanicum]|uniref:Uncharacterized protein n=1 Tax=Ancylostoma ceylanicum TaxID=53326 RepID=A0A016WFT8_9BILA|nr:hypothetical protein Y032_0702g1664 [Ancylostoma ceylanicum]
MPGHLGRAVGKSCEYGSDDGGVRKSSEHESTEGGWVHPDPAVRMASGCWSGDAEVRKRGHTGDGRVCQRWPNSEKNTRGGVHLAQAVVKTTRYGSSLLNEWCKRRGTGPPRRSSGVIHRVRVRLGQAVGKRHLQVLLGQAVMKTQGCRSALARQVAKTQGYRPSLAKQWGKLRIRVHLGKAVRTTPRFRSADGGARKRQDTGSPMKDRSVMVEY